MNQQTNPDSQGKETNSAPESVQTESVYEERIIAYIDILGFKNMVKRHDAAFIKEVLEAPREYFRTNRGTKRISTTLFSDSVVISCDCGNNMEAIVELLEDIYNITFMWMDMHIICRGAVVKGGMIHKDDGLLFGPGFINAVELEKQDNFPRIIIHQDIYDAITHHGTVPKTHPEGTLALFSLRDTDGVYSFNSLTAPIAKIKGTLQREPTEHFTLLQRIIESGIPHPKLRSKYRWVINKILPDIGALLGYSDEIFADSCPGITRDQLRHWQTYFNDTLQRYPESVKEFTVTVSGTLSCLSSGGD